MVIQERKLRRTCQGMLVGLVCLLASLLFLVIYVNAATVIKTGTVTATSLRVRSGPGTGYDTVGFVSEGAQGVITEEAPDSDGDIWYKWTVNGITGWSASWWISVTTTIVGNDGDFESYLTAQGFPESYKAQLRLLHAQYPNWVFEAQHTNLNWDDAIAAESVLGKNLVSGYSISSWKSTQEGAYNWQTGEWETGFDSGYWVAASSEIIQYYMDPRNFLDSTSIFLFLKQSYNTNLLTAEELAQKKSDLTNMVQNTFLNAVGVGTNTSYVDIIMEAGAQSGVSPFAIAAMILQEQGSDGSGRSVSGTVSGYEGYYNFLNMGAYKTAEFSSAVVRGLWFAAGSGSGKTTYRRPWTNAMDSIIGGAIYYGEGYVNAGQDTLYLKKFNVQGSNPYTHQYMTNVQGAASEAVFDSRAYDESARQASLIFKIPVYNNMPETACKQPTSDENPNYMLQSLEVAGYSLTPTFTMHETTYSLIVANEVQSVTVNAKALADTTNVAGTGSHSLNVGTNAIKITTTAQNGAQRTYTINIVRQEAVVPEPSEPQLPEVVIPTPSINSASYTMNSNNTITGITTFPISASSFAAQFSVTNGSVKITTTNGTVKTGNVGTGDQVRVYDNAGVHKLTYTVIIYGDTDGDGRVYTMDYVQIRKNLLGTLNLGGYNSAAADTNRNGKIDTLDYVQIRKQILGEYTIQQ